ncbi:MAG: AraC family transcriptional regulator [Pseudomonadales bacterium]|nr:AraC family transcriptional regulator [Pseudomonadales bacterium]
MSKPESILHPVAIPQVMINFAASYGVDQDTCLQGTGITEAELYDSEALVTRNQEMRLIENLMLALPDVSALGFKLGMQYNIATFGIWGFALRTSRTLRDAATVAMKYLPLSTAYCKVSPFETDEYYGICMDPDSIPPHLRQFLFERDMATGLNLMNELSLAGVSVTGLELQGEPLPYAEELEKLCGFKPKYHSTRNAMWINLKDVDRPLPTFDANLVRMLDDQCKAQLERRQTAGLSGQVRQQILGPLGLVATLDDIADALALSPRSLRRKLEQENTNFRAIVEEERKQIALQLLRGSDMKLEELAIHLGYTDTASFTRAFRRWMNCSPGEYRKTNRKAKQ